MRIQFYNDAAERFGNPDETNLYVQDTIQAGLEAVNRFDEGLASGTFDYYSKSDWTPEEWLKCRIAFDNGVTRDYFVDNTESDIAVVGANLEYKVTVNVIELVKVTQKIFPGNLNFSNDVLEDGTVITRTVRAVLERLNNQLWTVPMWGRANVPFRFEIAEDIPKLDAPAPELFFTENNLFECLERIGKFIGGFPELAYVAHGVYRLNYRMYGNPNTARHEYADMNVLLVHKDTENHANVVDSYAKNLLNTSADGKNALVYPAYEGFKAVEAAEYETEITNDAARITLPSNVDKILKWEVYYYYQDTADPFNPGKWVRRNITDITKHLYEYDTWKTFPDGSIWFSPTGKDKLRTAYYTRGGNKIENLKCLGNIFQASWGSETRKTYSRFVYIPQFDARVKSYKEGAIKPITTVINQAANILNAGEYANYLKGLVNRLTGEYKVLQRKFNKTEALPQPGEYINGEIIVETRETYFAGFVDVLFTTSKTFNRQSQFVDIAHENRQWSIPADSKVSDRELHYAENIELSIGVYPTRLHSGSLTAKGYWRLLAFNEDVLPPNLAYVAWKDESVTDSDADDNSIDYALMSFSGLPVDKSVIFSGKASDNNSMGVRAWDRWTGGWGDDYIAERQQFIGYNPKAEYMQLFVSDKEPSSFEFNNDYTGTGQEGGVNAGFDLTFPMSNKKQFTDGRGDNALIDFTWSSRFKIDKDLRERIIFDYQLDFVGKHGTIVYDRFASNCGFTSTSPAITVYVNSPAPYEVWDTKGRGTIKAIDSIDGFSGGDLYYGKQINIAGVTNYTNIAICDADGNLMLASNTPGSISASNPLLIYCVNTRKEFLKI